MKTQFITLFCFVIPVLFLQCQQKAPQQADASTATPEAPTYDSLLAQRLGADEIGMHRYVMAFLKAGPNRDQDSLTAATIQAGHMANIQRLAKEGKLVLAGPFMDDSEMAGIFIFNVATVEEAKTLTETDPAVKAGRLIMELHPWYGSAALMQVNDIHKKVAKKNF